MHNRNNGKAIRGFASVKEKIETIEAVLRDLSSLVGERQTQPARLATGGALVPGLGFQEDATALVNRAQDLRQGIFNMLVLGTFKNGKSTLLNALLGSAKLPAKAAPATAIITVLVRGESKQVAVYEDGRETPRRLDWEAFVREFQLTKEDQETLQQNKHVDRFQRVKYAQIECAHPICDNGVRLIDSPGLEEHISRTRVTTGYLKQSQAVILVLDATKILSEPERRFIDHTLGQGRLDHAFFVINKINLLDEDDAAEIKEYVQHVLCPHFLDERGQFDERFYRQRVFFVDARGALDARGKSDADLQAVEATGVPAFERELERFLTSEEKVKAALASTVQYLIYLVGRARKQIAEEKLALERPLQDLEVSREAAEKALRELERRKDDIERTIVLMGETIKQKVYANLMSYLDEMHETWPQDSQSLVNLEELTFWKIAKATVSEHGREEIANIIQPEMQRYVQFKFEAWAERIPVVISADLEKMTHLIEAQVGEFQVRLERITAMFSGDHSGDFADTEASQGKVSKFIQVVIGALLLDVSGVGGSVLGKGDWTSFFGRIMQQVILNLVLTIIFPPGAIFWIAYLIVEMIFVNHHLNKFQERLLESIGQKMNENLKKELAAKREEVQAAMGEQFDKLAQQITQSLAAQINETRAQQQRIIHQKQDANFNVEQECRRLDAIGDKLTELFGVVSQAAYGRSYTIEDLDRLTADNRGWSAEIAVAA
ncbi:MAG: dynamin family protein [Blastocatellia bacterium]